MHTNPFSDSDLQIISPILLYDCFHSIDFIHWCIEGFYFDVIHLSVVFFVAYVFGTRFKKSSAMELFSYIFFYFIYIDIYCKTHTCIWVEMGSCSLFAYAGLELQSSQSPPPK
jgi:hypothetical protein